MSIFIVATGSSHDTDWRAQRSLPEFRKATKNMLMVSSAIRQTLGPLQVPPDMGLVVGSSYGELETTKEFLITYAKLGLARPFLFPAVFTTRRRDLSRSTLKFRGLLLPSVKGF